MNTLILLICALAHVILGYTIADRTKHLGYYRHHSRQNAWDTPTNDSVYAFSVARAFDVLSGAVGVDQYKVYSGQGFSGSGGWPPIEQWISFTEMFRINKQKMRDSCVTFAPGVQKTTGTELQDLWFAIQLNAHRSQVDHRVILAVLLQESGGCVRAHNKAISTRPPNLENTTTFPGLMQAYNGVVTCNPLPPQPAHPEIHMNRSLPIPYPENNGILTPCPTHDIVGMIEEGTSRRHGLVGILNDIKTGYGAMQYGIEEAYTYYQAVRWYAERKGNTLPAVGEALEQVYYSDPCYTSDVANRLTGWVNAERVCDLKPVIGPQQVTYPN